MRKTIALSAVCVLALGGCNFEPDGNFPEPKPITASPTVSPSAINSEAPVTPPTKEPVEPTKGEDPKPTETTKPAPASPSASVDSGTPGTKFAKRWGEKYPNVPEFAILKAANGVCKVTEQFPDWTNNPIAEAGIAEIVKGFGIAENDGVEFTQDAQQNYCSSVSNPT